MVVAYQGEAGAFSEEGARALFPDADHRPFPSIRTVFESVEVGRAAELYGLEVLADRIQTYPDNYTRFGALSRDPSPLGTPDKSSFVFGVGHVSGSLYRCLGAFAERHLNLTKLESRPRPGRPWEYVFYADIA